LDFLKPSIAIFGLVQKQPFLGNTDDSNPTRILWVSIA